MENYNRTDILCVITSLLKGKALAEFELHTNQPPETNQNGKMGLEKVRRIVFPSQAVINQKCYIRRFFRKPYGTSIKDTIARIKKLNSYLPRFPPPILPDGTTGPPPTKLGTDELLDLLESSIPNSWKNQLVLKGFDVSTSTVQEFREHCEQFELLEAREGKGTHLSSESKHNKSKHAPKGKRKNDDRDYEKGGSCMLHGENCGHTTDECFTLKKQAKLMKAKGRLLKIR